MEKMTRKGMVALGVAALLSTAAMAQAETRFAVQDNVGVDKMVVTDSGFIGIGTNNPTVPVHVRGGNYGTSQIVSHVTLASGITDNNLAGGFIAKRNNPAGVNSGLPLLGQRIGYMLFGSVAPDLSDKNAAGFGAYAEANWTPTNFPAYFAVETAAPNTPRYEKLRVTGAGNVGIGAQNPTQRLEVNGGIRLNPTPVTFATTPAVTVPAPVKPACAEAAQGVIFFTKGATATTADLLEVCSKDGGGNFAWRSLIAVP